MTESEKPESPLASGWVLGAVGLGAAVMLVAVFYLTRDRIELQQARQAAAVLHQVLPEDAYDNELASDFIEAEIYGLAGTSRIYRARLDGEPVAAIYEITAPDGYSGPIDLLAGVRPDGTVIAVRVTGHRETPGLGDPIEAERSDWIFQFDDRSLEDPEPGGWAASRRGGEFDTITSATLTSQAVVVALRRVLEDFRQRRDELFLDTPPPDPSQVELHLPAGSAGDTEPVGAQTHTSPGNQIGKRAGAGIRGGKAPGEEAPGHFPCKRDASRIPDRGKDPDSCGWGGQSSKCIRVRNPGRD